MMGATVSIGRDIASDNAHRYRATGCGEISMQMVWDAMGSWLERGDRFVALATVVNVYRSAPRPEGAMLAVSVRGELVGSVSGGCIESDVAFNAAQVIETGVPQLLGIGIEDETAWAAGLTCGGAIEIWVERLDRVAVTAIADLWKRAVPAVSMTWIGGAPGSRQVVDAGAMTHVATGSDSPPEAVMEEAIGQARRIIGEGQRAPSGIREIIASDGMVHRVFLHAWPRHPRLIIFGAVHVAQSLVRFAHEVGFETCVIDPRSVFATDERLGHAGQLLRAWPQDAIANGQVVLDGSSFVVVLTHDPKLDEPALAAALRSDAPYIGCLGSRKTQEMRRTRLIKQGFSEAEVSRIRGPVGLDLGGRTPEELALAG
ncbi:MAG: XdhC/CoxI family protein [Chloroflexi bacterium]|nr:XdhC/CoxI family protein [Chloroflexota bacterium]